MEPRAFWAPLDRAELPVLKWVERTRRGGAINAATDVITRAGQHALVWYGIAGIAAAKDPARADRWRGAAANVAGVYLANTALKYVARRRRPPIASLGTPTDLSFPSSHAATSFAAARLFSSIEPRARLPLYAAAAAVTGSRLHFLVHYPSDLLAGAALGDIAARVID